MAIIRTPKTSNYTTMDNSIVKNKKLSWKARGLMIYLLSLPRDWEVYATELERRATDGEVSLRSGLNELIDAGYLKREQNRVKGKIESTYLTVREKPERGNLELEKPDLGNRALLKKDNTNKRKKGGASLPIRLEESFSMKCAKNLNKRLETPRKIKDSTFAKQIDRIMARNYITKKQMTTILKWYCKHYTDKYTPKIYKAQDLHDKWVQIVDARKRWIDCNGVEVSTLTAKEKFAVNRIFEEDWPKISEKDLTKAITVSMANYQEFYSRCRKVAKACKAIKKDKVTPYRHIAKFVRHFDKYHVLLPRDFVIDWFNTIHTDVCCWDEWSGSLKAFQFDVKSKRVSQWIGAVLQEYSGSLFTVDEFWEVFKDDSFLELGA